MSKNISVILAIIAIVLAVASLISHLLIKSKVDKIVKEEKDKE